MANDMHAYWCTMYPPYQNYSANKNRPHQISVPYWHYTTAHIVDAECQILAAHASLTSELKIQKRTDPRHTNYSAVARALPCIHQIHYSYPYAPRTRSASYDPIWHGIDCP